MSCINLYEIDLRGEPLGGQRELVIEDNRLAVAAARDAATRCRRCRRCTARTPNSPCPAVALSAQSPITLFTTPQPPTHRLQQRRQQDRRHREPRGDRGARGWWWAVVAQESMPLRRIKDGGAAGPGGGRVSRCKCDTISTVVTAHRHNHTTQPLNTKTTQPPNQTKSNQIKS